MSEGFLDTVLEGFLGESSSNHPHVISNGNLDMRNVEELWAGTMAGTGLDTANEKLAAGFEVLRIQTELMGDNNHVTRVYLVKRRLVTTEPPAPAQE